ETAGACRGSVHRPQLFTYFHIWKKQAAGRDQEPVLSGSDRSPGGEGVAGGPWWTIRRPAARIDPAMPMTPAARAHPGMAWVSDEWSGVISLPRSQTPVWERWGAAKPCFGQKRSQTGV